MVASAEDVVRDYTRWYCGSDDLYEVVIELEENWQVPLKCGRVLSTLKKFTRIQTSLPLRLTRNWRFQLIAYRVFCDAFVFMQQYGKQERETMRWPLNRGHVSVGGEPIVHVCREKLVDQEWFDPPAMLLFGRVEACAALLFAVGGIQLDVNRFSQKYTNTSV